MSWWVFVILGIVSWGYCIIKYPPGERSKIRTSNLFGDVCFGIAVSKLLFF